MVRDQKKFGNHCRRRFKHLSSSIGWRLMELQIWLRRCQYGTNRVMLPNVATACVFHKTHRGILATFTRVRIFTILRNLVALLTSSRFACSALLLSAKRFMKKSIGKEATKSMMNQLLKYLSKIQYCIY